MLSEYTRFDATHTRSISVHYQDFEDEVVAEDVAWLGLRVFTSNTQLAHVLGVEIREIESLKKAYFEAIDAGDHIFFMEMGEHGAYSFRLCLERPRRNWDSGWVGIIIVPKDCWHRAYPRKTYAKRYVYQKIQKIFEANVEARLNGWLYEAVFQSKDESIAYSGFLSPEEALSCAQSEYPEIRYMEDDFEEVTAYKLIANA